MKSCFRPYENYDTQNNQDETNTTAKVREVTQSTMPFVGLGKSRVKVFRWHIRILLYV